MATIVGVKEIESAMKKVSSGNAKRAAEGLIVALAIERESIAFYSAREQKAMDSDSRSFFSFLAGQEREHFAAINSLRESLEKSGKWIVPKLSKGKPVIFSKKDWDKKEGEQAFTAVLFALWKEKTAMEFYLGIAEKAKDKKIKDFFSALADFEKSHAELLGELAEQSFYTNELIMG